MTSKIHFTSALEDFRRARRQAALQSIVSHLAGRSDALLAYDDIRKQLRGIENADRKLQDIPIASIVGSVSRYTDFTRNFLPRQKVAPQRWAGVKAATATLLGLPPIEIYKIGEVYFVSDGNHRVSTARQSGNTLIQAYVKEVRTRVPISPDIQPDELIIKAEFVDFLEATRLDNLRAETDLRITSPGKYSIIQQQIEAIHIKMELDKKKRIPLQNAATFWHDRIYLPIVEIIRQRDLLCDFPERTETDLYLWITKYQRQLTKESGWDITPETTATTITARFSVNSKTLKTKIQTALQNWLFGPLTGKWRADQLKAQQGRMFADILVVFTGHIEENEMLDFGIYVAQLEGAQIFGLCILEPNAPNQEIKMQQSKKGFDDRCMAANVSGNMAFAFDKNPTSQIIRRARFADLVILPLYHRHFNPISIQAIIHNCPTPVVGLPKKTAIPLKKALLAYDGSPKSEEALYLAAYIARFWELSLVILSVFGDKRIALDRLAKSYEYLEKYGIPAEFVKASGPPAIATLTFAVDDDCDLIIAGSYGASPIKRVFTGSLVDKVLAKTRLPVLVCR